MTYTDLSGPVYWSSLDRTTPVEGVALSPISCLGLCFGGNSVPTRHSFVPTQRSR